MPSELLEDLRSETPDAARVAQSQRTVAKSLKRVRPLPADGVLIAMLMAGFIGLALIGVAPVGSAGFRALNGLQRIADYGTLLVAAWLLAAAIAEQMVPGARRRVPLALAVLFPLVAMAVLTPVLFPDFGMQRFVEMGVPCLRLGLLCAIPSGALTAIAMRQGFLTERRPAALAAAAMGGLVGVGVLALHCPVQNAPHILAWHAGVMVIAVLAGGAAGWVFTRGDAD